MSKRSIQRKNKKPHASKKERLPRQFRLAKSDIEALDRELLAMSIGHAIMSFAEKK